MVLRCPFNLLHIFKDGAHQSKTEFMLGPSSGVNIWIRHILGTQPSSPQSQFEHFSRDTVPLTSGVQKLINLNCSSGYSCTYTKFRHKTIDILFHHKKQTKRTDAVQ